MSKLYNYRSFSQLDAISYEHLCFIRDSLAEELAEHIRREQTVKAEILWYMNEIDKYEVSNEPV